MRETDSVIPSTNRGFSPSSDTRIEGGHFWQGSLRSSFPRQDPPSCYVRQVVHYEESPAEQSRINAGGEVQNTARDRRINREIKRANSGVSDVGKEKRPLVGSSQARP
ncbi:hypothetical protein KM043_002105 [Ampulex compressa]|nr:hypothetical protein KM043_002105 [Ampulex compressa]